MPKGGGIIVPTEKMQFHETGNKVPGALITDGGIKPNFKKVEAIDKILLPRN